MAGYDKFWASAKEPDRSKSDYYCRICDSHMNSLQMWESHITGKRHIKNAKKEPGEPPSKIKTVKRDDIIPYLYQLVKDVDEPVVGLNYMCELKKADPSLDPTYTCYLCHGTFIVSNVVDHLVSSKHRLNYIKEVDADSFCIIENLQFKKAAQDTLALQTCGELELKHGRGRPEVKVEISKHPLLPPPRKIAKASSSRMDTDTDAHSSASLNSEGACAAPPGVAQGIEDVDVLRDIKMMSMEMKLAVLQEMIIKNPRPIRNDEQAKIMLHSLRMLGQSLMQYKVRKLPADMLQKLYEDITNPDEAQAYSTILKFKKEKKK